MVIHHCAALFLPGAGQTVTFFEFPVAKIRINRYTYNVS